MAVFNIIVFTALCVLYCRGAIVITTGPDLPGRSEVQNMMRNSEHRSFCRPYDIKQVITHPNCVSKTVENQVCAGFCYSYSLPRTDPQIEGDEDLDFCESCQPSDSLWINVTLACTAEDESTYEYSKSVQQVENCSCSTWPISPRPTFNHYDDGSYEEGQKIPNALQPEEIFRNDVSDQFQPLSPSLPVLTSTTSLSQSSPTPISIKEQSSSMESSATSSPSAVTAEANDTEDPAIKAKGGDDHISFVPIQKSGIRRPNFGFGGPSILHDEEMQPSEQERHPNSLIQNEDKAPAGLANIMVDLSHVLQGGGGVKYTEVSLYELKRVLNLKPHQTDRLGGRVVYSVAPLQRAEENR